MIKQRWRLGSIDEVVAISQRIPEFNHPYDEQEYRRRLQQCHYWVRIAEVEGEVAGFAVAYTRDNECYLWMSGVLPDFRSLGLMASALDDLEQWAAKQGLQWLTVKSRNRYPSMLRLLLKHGFMIEKMEAKGETVLDHRIHFCKTLASENHYQL